MCNGQLLLAKHQRTQTRTHNYRNVNWLTLIVTRDRQYCLALHIGHVCFYTLHKPSLQLVQDLLLLAQKGGGNVSSELMEVQRKAKANGAVNHYRVLAVQATALPADIKSAYRYELPSNA